VATLDNMKCRFLPLLCCAIVLPVPFPHRLMAQRAEHDSFACTSRHYMLDDFEKQPAVSSPDKTKAVQLTKGYKFRVKVGDQVISAITINDISSNVEVGWSPDSSQFFISYSDGGLVGRYHVRLFHLIGQTLTENQVPSTVAESFKTKYWCPSRGNNLFYLDWTSDSKVGFFVAEVYPTGDCGKDLGVYRGYVVSLEDRRILRVFGEKETSSIEKECRASGRLVVPSQ
jgi:hypothetical protein